MLKRGDLLMFPGDELVHVVVAVHHHVGVFEIACRPDAKFPIIGWHPKGKVPSCLHCLAK